MKYVLDTSAAFKWVVAEPNSDKAIRLREDYRNGIHELLAPDLFLAEIANSLLGAERGGRLGPGQFAPYLTDVLTTCPLLTSTFSLLPVATAIASKIRISFYDCLYVALSELEKCQLVTADDKLIKVAQPLFPQVISVSSLP